MPDPTPAPASNVVTAAVAIPLVSPTGQVVLPQWALRYFLPLLGIAIALQGAGDLGIVLPPQVLLVDKYVLLIGTLLGLIGQGIRKNATQSTVISAVAVETTPPVGP